MKIQELRIDCDKETCVKVWAVCHSQEDIDDVIAWLRLAKTVMREWEKINAKAPRQAKAPTGKHETAQSGKVQGEPQTEGWANG